jgi:hypothetical protein
VHQDRGVLGERERTAIDSTDLLKLVVASLGKVTDPERPVSAQRDEIAWLKGLKGAPSIRPSGMEQ